MAFHIQTGVDNWRIIGPNGEEGPLSRWDDGVAVIKIGNEVYQCICDDENAEEFVIERVLNTTEQETITSTEEVLFDGEEEEDDAVSDTPDEDEEEDDEEEEEVGPRLV